MKQILSFIESKFSSMPKSVQILTYLTMLILLVHMITLPGFIDMKLVSNVADEEFPIRDAEIQIEVSGRTIRILTDQYGRFSVPISTWLPTNSIVFVLNPNPENNSIKEVEVPLTNSYLNRTKLVFNNIDMSYIVTPYGLSESISSMLTNINMFSAAYAAEKELYDYTKIKEETINILSIVSGKRNTEIIADDKIYGSLKLDNIDISYVNSKLEKIFNVDMWRVLKNTETTVLQLIEEINIEAGKNNTTVVDKENIERRTRKILISERNDHCEDGFKVFTKFIKPEEGWKIDIQKITPNINVSSRSTFSGITNPTEYGFVVTGRVINNGDCINLMGQKLSIDGRGHLVGDIKFEEFRIVAGN